MVVRSIHSEGNNSILSYVGILTQAVTKKSQLVQTIFLFELKHHCYLKEIIHCFSNFK